MMRLVFILVLICSSLAQAQEFTAEYQTGSRIDIGEHAIIKVLFRYPSESDPPGLKPLSEGDMLTDVIEIRKIEPLSEDADGAVTELTQVFHITAWDSGRHVVPGFQAFFDGDTVFSNTLALDVASVRVDMADGPKDIAGIYEEEWSTWDQLLWWLKHNWYYLLAGLVLAGALTWLIVYLVKRRMNKEEIVLPDLPPHELAYSMIDRLDEKKLWQNGQIKGYHSELSEIIRLYLEKRFQVTALEQTTDEILQNLRFTEMNGDAKQMMTEILRLSDLVKFAKEQPLASENERVMSHARDFVSLTFNPEPSANA